MAQGLWRLFFLLRDRVRAIQLSDLKRVAVERLLLANRTLGGYLPIDARQRVPDARRRTPRRLADEHRRAHAARPPGQQCVGCAVRVAAQALGRSQDGNLVGAWARNLDLGRSFARAAEVDAQLMALTLDQVNIALRKYIDPSRMVLGVAGDFRD